MPARVAGPPSRGTARHLRAHAGRIEPSSAPHRHHGGERAAGLHRGGRRPRSARHLLRRESTVCAAAGRARQLRCRHSGAPLRALRRILGLRGHRRADLRLSGNRAVAAAGDAPLRGHDRGLGRARLRRGDRMAARALSRRVARGDRPLGGRRAVRRRAECAPARAVRDAGGAHRLLRRLPADLSPADGASVARRDAGDDRALRLLPGADAAVGRRHSEGCRDAVGEAALAVRPPRASPAARPDGAPRRPLRAVAGRRADPDVHRRRLRHGRGRRESPRVLPEARRRALGDRARGCRGAPARALRILPPRRRGRHLAATARPPASAAARRAPADAGCAGVTRARWRDRPRATSTGASAPART